jgi:hypothetical protein
MQNYIYCTLATSAGKLLVVKSLFRQYNTCSSTSAHELHV